MEITVLLAGLCLLLLLLIREGILLLSEGRTGFLHPACIRRSRILQPFLVIADGRIRRLLRILDNGTGFLPGLGHDLLPLLRHL